MLLITGCARSGTSLTAQLLQAHGWALGQVNSLFENTGIREGVLKPLLEDAGGDRMGQDALPPRDAKPHAPGLAERVGRQFAGERKAYKDAKLCLIWRTWAEAFPDAQWVIVRRDAVDIARSCMRTPFMRAFNTEAGWLDWVREHELRFDDMKQHLNVREVWPSDWIGGNLDSLRALVEWAGGDFDPAAAAQIIKPDSWHGAAS